MYKSNLFYLSEIATNIFKVENDIILLAGLLFWKLKLVSTWLHFVKGLSTICHILTLDFTIGP